MDTFPGYVYNFCMMSVMVKEADLDRIEVPENYEVLDATALGRRLASSGTQCLPTYLEGTSAAYLAPTANLRWDPSGMRGVSESGKRRRRAGRVAGAATVEE